MELASRALKAPQPKKNLEKSPLTAIVPPEGGGHDNELVPFFFPHQGAPQQVFLNLSCGCHFFAHVRFFFLLVIALFFPKDFQTRKKIHLRLAFRVLHHVFFSIFVLCMIEDEDGWFCLTTLVLTDFLLKNARQFFYIFFLLPHINIFFVFDLKRKK